MSTSMSECWAQAVKFKSPVVCFVASCFPVCVVSFSVCRRGAKSGLSFEAFARRRCSFFGQSQWKIWSKRRENKNTSHGPIVKYFGLFLNTLTWNKSVGMVSHES